MSVDVDIFDKINNALLDLQAADLQTYERPLKALVRLLHHPALEETTVALSEKADLDAFLKDSAATQGGMVGSGKLAWPEDHAQSLGLTIQLLDKFAADPDYVMEIGHEYFYTGNNLIGDVRAVVRQLIIPFVRDYKDFVLSKGAENLKIVHPVSNKIFIVHGHDEGARETVARFIESIGFEAIILHEQANRGRTVIEKIEVHSDVGFAIILLTPDDEGCVKGGKLEPRARQNVLLELGYFIGRLTRHRVCALKRGQVEIPSDFAGVVWTEMDSGNGWKTALGKELQAAGYSLDWNKVMR